VQGSKNPLTVADVLRTYAAQYLAMRGAKMSLQERRVLAQLIDCRTVHMGGHAWKCDECGAIRACYDSCRNRHCPTCRGAARANWLEQVRQDLLPVPYFHVVQTIPHEPNLDRLVLANRQPIYGLLFQATARALLQLAADERYLGARIGLLMVLHTWGQLMEPHHHVHVVIPGGGLSPDGTRWLNCRDEFFLPVRVIGALVRGKFLAGLKQLWREGKLKLDGKLAPLAEKRRFEEWLSGLYHKNWVTFAQGPPSGIKGPEAVLKYLTRYVSGVAISDKRLVSHAAGRVVFRWKNYRAGGREQTTSVTGVEFVRRYMQHVLPRGLVRIRYYGLLSNRHRVEQLARCRTLLGESSEAAAAKTTSQDIDWADPQAAANAESSLCPICKRGRLVLTETWLRTEGWPWETRRTMLKAYSRAMPQSINEHANRAPSDPSEKRPPTVDSS
jgi:hypothetical protein